MATVVPANCVLLAMGCLLLFAWLVATFTQSWRYLPGRWSMFTSDVCVMAELFDNPSLRGAPYPIYHHVASHDPSMSQRDFFDLLEFLRRNGVTLYGKGVVLGADAYYAVEIFEGRIVDRRVMRKFSRPR